MHKQVITTHTAPGAVGPYSQAIVANDMVFTAGQLGIDPATKQLVDGDIRAQTRQALLNVQHVLEAAGSSLDKVVKVTVFLKNMDDFAAMNEVYATFFVQNPPARSTVEVARLPLDGLVEVEAVALV
jgi:2-iminobutanoate/2-iminopropanoate deaminase